MADRPIRLLKNGAKTVSADDQVADLVDEAYASTLDPGRYDRLMSLWNDFVQARVKASRLDRNSTISNALLESHFNRALEIFDRLGRSLRTVHGAAMLVDSLPLAALVMDRNQRILAANGAIRRFLTTGDQPHLRHLLIDDPTRSRLESWLGNGVPASEPILFLPCRLGAGQAITCLTVTRVDLAGSGMMGHLASCIGNGTYYLLTTTDLQLDDAVAKAFGETYGLTSAEVEVAMALAGGIKPKDIALRRGVSINTVRTQIKLLQQKLDLASLPVLVRLICGFAASQVITRTVHARSQRAGRLNRTHRHGSLLLPDDRRLAFEDLGAADGRPVLLIHNMIHGTSLTDTAIEVAARRGWRFIAPSRPGFGDSDPHPGLAGGDLLDAVALDWIRLLDHLGIDRIRVLGHLCGGVYGLRFARTFANRVQGLALLNYVPAWHDDRLSRLPARFRVIAATTRYAPTLLPFIIRAGVAHVDAGHEDLFLRAFHGDIARDMGALRRPEVRRVVLDGLRHTVRQGGHAVALDCPMVLTDFTDDARSITLPAEIILGADDQVVQPRDGRDFVNSAPHFRLNEIEGAGFYLLYTHWPRVFDILERLDPAATIPVAPSASRMRRSA